MGVLAELRRSSRMSLCQECGKCTTMCPLSASGDFSARMIACQDSQDGIHAYADAVDRCLTCAACEQRCPQGVQFSEFVRGARALLPPGAQVPCPHGQVFESAARMMANTGSDSPARDTDWLHPDLEVAEEGETALFVGCLPLFNVLFEKEFGLDMMDIPRAAIRLLNHTGIKPVLIANERCCGHDLLWGGDRETFTALAKANTSVFAERGIKHILTTCAECCRTWRLDYPEVVPDYRPRVEHFSEFLAAQIKAGKLSFEGNGDSTVTFQDPCRLGRHLGVVEAPRQVLQAVPGTTVVEMQRKGRDAVCCGTSGFIHCDETSRRLQEQRLGSACETGADKLLTACPKCLIHFTCAQVEDRRTERPSQSVQVEDLTVFVAKTLPSAEGRSEEESEADPIQESQKVGSVSQ